MDECKGCRTYEGVYDKSCSGDIIPHLSETEHCPCLNCLVKGMCEEVCPDLYIYIELMKSRKEMNIK